MELYNKKNNVILKESRFAPSGTIEESASLQKEQMLRFAQHDKQRLLGQP